MWEGVGSGVCRGGGGDPHAQNLCESLPRLCGTRKSDSTLFTLSDSTLFTLSDSSLFTLSDSSLCPAGIDCDLCIGSHTTSFKATFVKHISGVSVSNTSTYQE